MILFWITLAAVAVFDGYSIEWTDRRTRVIYWITAAVTAALGTLCLSAGNTFSIAGWLFD